MSDFAGDRLVAEGRVIRAGRRITVVTAEVRAEASGAAKTVALLQGTMIAVGGADCRIAPDWTPGKPSPI